MINPKIKGEFQKYLSSIINDDQIIQKMLMIFSKNSFLLLKNKDLLKLQDLIPDYEKRKLNVKILEKSRKSFKFNETLLLGMIIDFLELHI